jgi:hypothetical protein
MSKPIILKPRIKKPKITRDEFHYLRETAIITQVEDPYEDPYEDPHEDPNDNPIIKYPFDSIIKNSTKLSNDDSVNIGEINGETKLFQNSDNCLKVIILIYCFKF